MLQVSASVKRRSEMERDGARPKLSSDQQWVALTFTCLPTAMLQRSPQV